MCRSLVRDTLLDAASGTGFEGPFSQRDSLGFGYSPPRYPQQRSGGKYIVTVADHDRLATVTQQVLQPDWLAGRLDTCVVGVGVV